MLTFAAFKLEGAGRIIRAIPISMVTRIMSSQCRIQTSLISADALLCQKISRGLGENGRVPETHGSVACFQRTRQPSECRIVVLDADLPDDTAFELMAQLRSSGNIGIILLSNQNSVAQRVRAMAAGADICLGKQPVDMLEISAVIDALERRLAEQQPAPPQSQWHLSNGGWVLNDAQGAKVELTRLERAFISCLFENLYEPVSREKLIAAIGGDPYEYAPHRIDVLASRLRRKASRHGATLSLRSVRGTGYALTA